VKTVLLPLTIKSVRSTKAMQELQPKIKELQRKYGQDRQRLSAETMKLYQEHGINPMSGCLPMLLQIPIFFGLYYAIRHLSTSGTGVWGNGFLWLPSLAKDDPYHVLPLLAGLFQLVQALMTRPAGQKIRDPQQQAMQNMMLFTPLMVVIFGWRFASGPVLYWAVSAIYSVVQQWFITGWGGLLDWLPWLPDIPEHRRLGYEDPSKRAERMANGRKPSGGLFGLMNRQIEQQIAKVEQERETTAPSKPKAKAGAAQSTKRARPADGAAATPQPRPDLVPRKPRPRKQRGGGSDRSG
ncbi:MAG: membrane protein insertase YidC, partial [Thermomicrobiaceae bacterium]|nr:membrane protein insertase YidC [Thermomicrobiaceae bacterium]